MQHPADLPPRYLDLSGTAAQTLRRWVGRKGGAYYAKERPPSLQQMKAEDVALNADTGDMITKRSTSFRLSPEALRLLALLAENDGISQAGALEIAIRTLAKQKGLK
jgi:hypothetical protein